MVGLRKEVVKASTLAASIAILLGVSTYLISRQIESIGPKKPATIDAYTERGGLGSSIVGSFYEYDESISIFAHVMDRLKNPISDANVTFTICGPVYSNITLVETALTNSSGIAVINLDPLEEQFDKPETFLGTWSATAVAEGTGTEVSDSLAFEVEPHPSSFIDIYTDRGGEGTNIPSQPYSLNETVRLHAKVTNGTSPILNGSVTFFVYEPAGKPRFVTLGQSDASGVATKVFRVPPVKEFVGTWQVIATVRVDGELYVDSLTFKCLP